MLHSLITLLACCAVTSVSASMRFIGDDAPSTEEITLYSGARWVGEFSSVNITVVDLGYDISTSSHIILSTHILTLTNI